MNDNYFDRWQKMSLTEQMANIGSEVYRAGSWKLKNNEKYSQKAFERALELIDLSLACNHRQSAIREIARVREFFCGLFLSDNTDGFESLNKYFHYFALSLKR
ncbi:MAG: hypothetical protein LBI42_01100 [Chitinispirillales bacterium]|jgi:hypothetical protein|nr:hypothetical protein [Chitinispirillales bacterium]